MYDKKMLSLEEADKIVDAILAHSREEKGVPISIAVVDFRGDLVKFVRMDGASWNTVRVAQIKAYSAAKFRRDTAVVGDWMSQLNIQLADWADPNVTSLAGGVCIWDEHTSPRSVVGAVAVSGWPDAEVDVEYARVGIAALK